MSIRKCSKREIIIVAVVMVLFMGIVFRADAWQQNRFAEVREAYVNLSAGNYQEAEIQFEDYFSVDSKLYWSLIEYFNDDEYSRKQVAEAIKKCKSERGVLL